MGLKERCALGALRLRSRPKGFQAKKRQGTRIVKIGSRCKVEGIQDAERPMGLKERFGLRPHKPTQQVALGAL